jgi:hypothetical protein
VYCFQVLATKDEEAIKLCNTVDGLRAVLAEKDSVSIQQCHSVGEIVAEKLLSKRA